MSDDPHLNSGSPYILHTANPIKNLNRSFDVKIFYKSALSGELKHHKILQNFGIMHILPSLQPAHQETGSDKLIWISPEILAQLRLWHSGRGFSSAFGVTCTGHSKFTHLKKEFGSIIAHLGC